MASNYVDLYHNVDNDTMTEQEGLELHGRDGVFCTSPVYADIPLLTESQDLARAINELKKGLDEGGGDDSWSPPKEWPKVPEPTDYEVYLLVSADDYGINTNQVRFSLVHPINCSLGKGAVSVDWGDGSIDVWGDGEWNTDFMHTYSNYGLYVVKITTSAYNCFFGVNADYMSSNWLIAKLGDEVIVGNGGDNNQWAFYQQHRLQYVKMSGKGGLASNYCFYECNALRKIDISNPPETIPTRAFSGCYNLSSFDLSKVREIKASGISGVGFKKIDIPLCTKIGNYGIQRCYNLQEINAPICGSVGDYGFNANYGLTKYTVSDSCTFGTNAFNNCYSLYPYK